MAKRFITAFILIVLAVSFFVLRQVHIIIFDIAIIAVIAFGLFEMLRVFKKDFNIFMIILLYLTLVALLPVYLYFKLPGICVLLIISFVANLILSVFKTDVSFNGISLYSLLLIYPMYLMFLFVVLNHTKSQLQFPHELGLFYILLVACICVFCDSLALFTGITFKGPKLAPKLSPKKTISGAVGGLIGGILGAMIVYLFLTYIVHFDLGMFKAWQIVLIGLFGGVFAEIGDLAASGIKRKLGIKDFSNVLPGHGGVMDRLDSLMFTAFAVFIFSLFF